jgi:hypothetical protein
VERLRIHRQHFTPTLVKPKKVNLVRPRLPCLRIREIGNPNLISHSNDEVHIPNAHERVAAGCVLATACLQFGCNVEYSSDSGHGASKLRARGEEDKLRLGPRRVVYMREWGRSQRQQEGTTRQARRVASAWRRPYSEICFALLGRRSHRWECRYRKNSKFKKIPNFFLVSKKV